MPCHNPNAILILSGYFVYKYEKVSLIFYRLVLHFWRSPWLAIDQRG